MLAGRLRLPSVRRCACSSPCPSVESLCLSCVGCLHVHVPVNEQLLLQREALRVLRRCLLILRNLTRGYLRVSVTGYYTAHTKTLTNDWRGTQPAQQKAHKPTNAAKVTDTQRLVQTQVVSAVCHCLRWLADITERRSYTTCVWTSWWGLTDKARDMSTSDSSLLIHVRRRRRGKRRRRGRPVHCLLKVFHAPDVVVQHTMNCLLEFVWHKRVKKSSDCVNVKIFHTHTHTHTLSHTPGKTLNLGISLTPLKLVAHCAILAVL